MSKASYAEMIGLANAGKKIAAIKHLRTNGVQIEAPDDRIGLREAKHAVEHAMGIERDPCCVIIPPLLIKKVIVQTGKGEELELDLDGLQLKILDGLGTLPMSYMASSLELMTFLRNWNRFGNNGEKDA
jgi:hypothetical protein